VHAAGALDALERPEEAMKELELGASRLPGNVSVLAALGWKHMALRRPSQAKATWEKIVARDAATVAIRHVLVGYALEGQGRCQEALREVQAARDIAPTHGGALTIFARCAGVVGRFDEAISALESAAKLPNAPADQYAPQIQKLRDMKTQQELRRSAAGVR
jgi:tetratricopeptide (TPR) repeat protein